MLKIIEYSLILKRACISKCMHFLKMQMIIRCTKKFLIRKCKFQQWSFPPAFNMAVKNNNMCFNLGQSLLICISSECLIWCNFSGRWYLSRGLKISVHFDSVIPFLEIYSKDIFRNWHFPFTLSFTWKLFLELCGWLPHCLLIHLPQSTIQLRPSLTTLFK